MCAPPRTVFAILLLSSVFLGRAGGQKPAAKPVPAKWQAVAAQIKVMLSKQPSVCDEGTLRATPIDAADFDGESFALVDVCPLGAYTELITVMQLKDNRPVAVRFREHGSQVGLEFSQGASVMHGRNVELVREKRAIYDIDWDNEGDDTSGTVRLQSCRVNAYVWNSAPQTFDFDPILTKRATRDYCHEHAHRVP